MNITVNLYASFRCGRFKTASRHYPEAVTVRAIVEDLGLPVRDLGIVLRNGIHSSTEETLQEGDSLSLLPRIGGG